VNGPGRLHIEVPEELLPGGLVQAGDHEVVGKQSLGNEYDGSVDKSISQLIDWQNQELLEKKLLISKKQTNQNQFLKGGLL